MFLPNSYTPNQTDKFTDYLENPRMVMVLNAMRLLLILCAYKHFCLRKGIFNEQKDNSQMEHYIMDGKIIQHIIQEILNSQEYTMEGIAYQTHIPFEVIYDVAFGINRHFSLTPWMRILEIYIQIKPEVGKMLANALLRMAEGEDKGLQAILKGIQR